MNIFWCKCMLQSRCRLTILNLNNDHFNNLIGVYVIWYGNDTKNVVRVGKGIIRDELIKSKSDEKVLAYGPDLFVTWAEVPEASLDGVEAFLCKELNPILTQTIKCSELITVKLP